MLVRSSTCSRSSASCAATSSERLGGVPGIADRLRHPAAGRPRRTATGCRSRSTRRPSRRRRVSTTRTSRSSARSSSSARRRRSAGRAVAGVFARAAAITEEHGLILADTKFEFGADPETGGLILADEVLTPDSSRYWDAETYARGRDARAAHGELRQADRARLARRELGPRHAGGRPTLPHEIVERTAARYRELLERLTGGAPRTPSRGRGAIPRWQRSRRHPPAEP